MKLWTRISLAQTMLLVLAMVVVVVLSSEHFRTVLEHEDNHWSQLFSEALAKAVLRDTLEGKTRQVTEVLRRITRENDEVDYLLVTDFDNNVLTSSFDFELPDFLSGAAHEHCEFNQPRHFSLNGGKVTDIAFPLVDNLSAHIHVGLNENHLRAAIATTQIQFLVIALATTAIGIMFAFYFGRRISRPIETLSRKVLAFGRGDTFDPPSTADAVREVRDLIDSFSEMARERIDKESELERYRDRLEDLVSQRTAALEQEVDRHQKTGKQLSKTLEQAERANQAKTEFLSHMSHELRTPLNAVLGFAQLLEFELAENPVARDNVNEIITAGRHLLNLINDVLDLSRIENGKVEYSIEPVSWTEVMQESINLIKTNAADASINLQLSPLPSTAPIVVTADRVRLKQCCVNLLSNAIKYNKPGGMITVSFTAPSPGTWRLSVSDTGVGIPAKAQEKLFEAFNRLGYENSTVEGTGIGLVITKRLIESMDGSIGFNSAEGAGTTFWVELPQSDAELPASDQPTEFAVGEEVSRAETAVPGKPYTVVYIEDNPSNLKLVSGVFAKYPHIRMINTSSGTLGLDLINRTDPNLVLLDINLPDISGYTVMKRLGSDPATRHIPVIAITANATTYDLEKQAQYGFAAYLTKPINIDELLNEVKKYVPLKTAGQ